MAFTRRNCRNNRQFRHLVLPVNSIFISSILTALEEQDIALTGRNTTGPPWSVTDDDRRRQTPESKTILPHTLRVGGPVITIIC